jgi:non-heme Fe2+,alpha-ketoglutarate-dependent halogenase
MSAHATQTADDIAETYRRDGFALPVRVMSADDASGYRAELERMEQLQPGEGSLSSNVAGYGFLTLPVLDELMRLPSILDPVESILGPDLLVWGTSLFIKEPNTPTFVSWHQDLHYWGLEADDEVSAWVALSPATTASGCMRFVPGSHRVEYVEHRDTFHANNLLTRGQELALDVDEGDAIDAELAPGEMSLHHGRLFHASNANTTDDRRIGVAIRFIAPHMRQRGGVRTSATLVRGTDQFGHFESVPAPTAPFTEDGLAAVREAKARNRSILYDGAEQPATK